MAQNTLCWCHRGCFILLSRRIRIQMAVLLCVYAISFYAHRLVSCRVFFVIIPVQHFWSLCIFFLHHFHFISLFVSVFSASLLIFFLLCCCFGFFSRHIKIPLPNKRRKIYIFVIQMIVLIISARDQLIQIQSEKNLLRQMCKFIELFMKIELMERAQSDI